MKIREIIIVCLGLLGFVLLLSFCARDTPMRRMMRDVPEAIEVFEQSREHLETLRTGGFGERELWARIFSDGLGIAFGHSEGGGRIDYEEWHTLEWLAEEEGEALVYLLTSEELSRNFIRVASPVEPGVISATVYETGGGAVRDVIEIRHGGGEAFEFYNAVSRDSYIRDLGDGWMLWIYILR